jgi:HD-GYP domain-containing protein (c-di-GMP phosphodiesterase class II)
MVPQDMKFEVTNQSIIGNCAINKEVYCFTDMDETVERLGLTYDRTFDESIGEYMHNMLVVPVINYHEEAIGVLLLGNKIVNNKPTAYTDDEIEIARSLTSQVATLIDRTQLFNDVESMINSFIETLVISLEQRDPITSGHSKRVAELSLGLLEYIVKRDEGPFKDFYASEDELRELYFSAMLHDLGKIGVKESVLMKENKLNDDELRIIELRYELIKMKLISNNLNNRLIDTIDDYYLRIEEINRSNHLTDDNQTFLEFLKDYDLNDYHHSLLTNDEFNRLMVRKGNLTVSERKQIEGHASISFDILSKIHWTKRLKRIPQIASLHHEKLDGSGYPLRLVNEEIPLGSKIIGIADIYDALTTSDRTYKEAMSEEKTFRILREDAIKGKIDSDLVEELISYLKAIQ